MYSVESRGSKGEDLTVPANAIIRHSDRDKSATWNVGPRNCVGPRVTAQADESDGDGTC